MRRLEERRDARSAEWRPLGQLIDRAERWLADLPADAVISPAETEPVKLLKGESPTAAVDRLRRKRRDLLADLQAVDCAPITSTNAKALARAEVERLADKGRPDLFSLIEHGEGIKWPENRVSAPLMGFATSEGAPLLQGHAHATIVDALALTVWLHKDALWLGTEIRNSLTL